MSVLKTIQSCGTNVDFLDKSLAVLPLGQHPWTLCPEVPWNELKQLILNIESPQAKWLKPSDYSKLKITACVALKSHWNQKVLNLKHTDI